MDYFYLKTINNNAICATNEYHHEVIILGKAIGIKCNRSFHSLVDKKLIERVFIADNENRKYIETIIGQIPYTLFKVVDDVIKQAEDDLQTKFKDVLYLSLLDHIYFAYKTWEDKQKIENPLLNELKMFNSKEFNAAKHSIQIINNTLKTDFDEHEAAFIAFHYINALSNLSSFQNKTIMKDLEQTVNYLDKLTNYSLDKSSYLYGRLLIHLKCLFNRLVTDERIEYDAAFINDFSNSLKVAHEEEWEYAVKISSFMKYELHLNVNDGETAYLTMHIVPILKQKGGKQT